MFPFLASKFRVLLAIWFVFLAVYSGNSIVSGGNWCPYQKSFTMHKSKYPAPKLEILHPNQKGTMQVIIGRWPLVHIIYEVILEKPDHFIWKWMNCDKRCYVMSLRLTLLKISRSQYEWIWMNIFVSAFCYDLIKFTYQYVKNLQTFNNFKGGGGTG